MVNILVTGSNGRLAKLTIKELNKNNYNILTYNRSITNKEITNLINTDIDIILHIAGNYSTILQDNIRDNISLTNNILRLAKNKGSKILVIGSTSIFYKLSNYSYSKAVVNSLVIEYANLYNLDVTLINLPDIHYRADNIFYSLEQQRKEREIIVDPLVFEYVKGKEVAQSIVNWVKDGKINLKRYKVNLWDKFKNKKNVKMGKPKDFYPYDEHGVILKYR